jgi:adenosine 3'-phospho 5'-phosphosulfate transporter B2
VTQQQQCKRCHAAGSLLIYGVLQERIMTIGFGPHAEIFQHSIFLVLCNRLVTCLVAFGAAAAVGADITAAAPRVNYWLVSCTNVVATSCQYEALKHVSFAVQTLAKSAKVCGL